VPKIQFSDQICRRYINDTSNGYEFKICNRGNRNIFDIDVYFNIRIKGLPPDPTLYEEFIIPIGTCDNKITKLIPSNKGITMSINANQLDISNKEYFPECIKNKSKSNQLTLDDLYKIGTEVYGEITLFGYDSFSGTRKHFCSHQYKITDFLDGEFELNSLKIKMIARIFA
jgi:hypothetical protein